MVSNSTRGAGHATWRDRFLDVAQTGTIFFIVAIVSTPAVVFIAVFGAAVAALMLAVAPAPDCFFDEAS